MPNCIVRGCNFRWRKKDPDIALHVFPKDMEIIKTWLLHINQDFGDLNEFCHKIFNSSRGTYRICSQHFTLDAYEIRGMVTFLKKDAIPTIFPQEEMGLPTRKRRKKDISPSQSEADTSNTVNLPFTSMTFSVNKDLEMPWNPETSHCLGMKISHSTASSVHSYIHPGQPEEAAPYICKHRSRPTRTIGTAIDYFPGQVHRSTQLNKPMGTKDKNLQTVLTPSYRSVGIQCNLDGLPSLSSLSTVTSSGPHRLCWYRNWTKLLHYRSQAYLHDDWQ
ncbi:uncharacterized protein ACMZJ9_001642 [Mantella aurantiaca]